MVGCRVGVEMCFVLDAALPRTLLFPLKRATEAGVNKLERAVKWQCSRMAVPAE